MQFDFKDALAQGVRFNSSRTGSGGYGAMEMKTTTIPALVDVLPSWLKNRLIEFSCKCTNNGNNGSVVTVTGNKLAIRSNTELGVSYRYVEGTAIPYLTQSSDNRKRKRGHSGGNQEWWTRSPENGSWLYWCYTNASGNVSTSTSAEPQFNQYGLAPFGCL